MRELNVYALPSIGIIILGAFAVVHFYTLKDRCTILKFISTTGTNLLIIASILELLNLIPYGPLSDLPPHSLGMLFSTYYNKNQFDQDIAWSPDNTRLSTRCGNHGLYIWSVTSGKRLVECRKAPFDDPTCSTIAWSPDGRYIAASNDNLEVQIWNAESGHELMTYQSHKEDGDAVCVEKIVWSPDSLHIISASNVGTIRVWNILSGKQLMVHSVQSDIRTRYSAVY